MSDDDKVLICVGRLDRNKNQGFLISAMAELLKKDKSYQLLLAGPDEASGKYQKLAKKLNVDKNVHFLGFRKDVVELLQISDLATSVSIREGLGLNLIEALINNVPIVASDNRGHRDIVDTGSGFVVGDDQSEFIEAVKKIEHFDNKVLVNSGWLLPSVAERMRGIYEE